MLSAAPYLCRGRVPSPPGGLGWRNSPFCWRLALPCAAVPPHFFGLAQRNGVEPQRKTLMGWWRPREVSGPTRLSHSRGRCHSAAKVSASRTDWITRPRGEGFGLDVDWRLKVFCPAFLQKSGRGPGAVPLDVSLCFKSAGGGFRGNPRRWFPLLFSLPCTCAPLRWEVFVSPCCRSTPFLWCLPKETVSSRQRKAL